MSKIRFETQFDLLPFHKFAKIYTVWRPLGRDVLLCSGYQWPASVQKASLSWIKQSALALSAFFPHKKPVVNLQISRPIAPHRLLRRVAWPSGLRRWFKAPTAAKRHFTVPSCLSNQTMTTPDFRWPNSQNLGKVF